MHITAMTDSVAINSLPPGDFEAERPSDETARSGWCDSAEPARMTCFGTFETKSYPLAQTLFARV